MRELRSRDGDRYDATVQREEDMSLDNTSTFPKHCKVAVARVIGRGLRGHEIVT